MFLWFCAVFLRFLLGSIDPSVWRVRIDLLVGSGYIELLPLSFSLLLCHLLSVSLNSYFFCRPASILESMQNITSNCSFFHRFLCGVCVSVCCVVCVRCCRPKKWNVPNRNIPTGYSLVAIDANASNKKSHIKEKIAL